MAVVLFAVSGCGEQQLTVQPSSSNAAGQVTFTSVDCRVDPDPDQVCLSPAPGFYEPRIVEPYDEASEPGDPNRMMTQEEYDALLNTPGDTSPMPSTTIEVTTTAPTTTVVLSLYRARNGDPTRGELVDRIYVERNVAAAGLGDLDPDGDGWALVGRTNGAGDNGKLARFWMANNSPQVSTRHPAKGCLTLTPTSLAKVSAGQTRLMTEVAQNTANCRTLPPEADADANGVADNVQPLYPSSSTKHPISLIAIVTRAAGGLPPRAPVRSRVR
jgi:hypothetical protein